MSRMIRRPTFRPFRPAAARLLAVGALAAGLAAPATANAGVLDSVSGWWPMYEGSGQTVHDLSGHGNNGTLGSTPGADANDPTWIKTWLFGSALRFDGNDYVRIPGSSALSTTNLTVSTWARGTAPGAYSYIIGRGAKGCEAGTYAVYNNSQGDLQFYIYDTAGQVHNSGVVPAATAWNGKWHHIAGSWDGTTAKLFFDGKLVPGSSSAPGTIDNNLPTTSDVTFGNYAGTCDLLYTGDVDDVAIFSQALPVDKYWPLISLTFPRPLR
jgi:hypothetical protein